MFEKIIALFAASAAIVKAAKKLEKTTAFSSYGIVVEGDAQQAALGSTQFKEISGFTGPDKNETTFVSTWAYLASERGYALRIVDDDQDDCAGTPIVE